MSRQSIEKFIKIGKDLILQVLPLHQLLLPPKPLYGTFCFPSKENSKNIVLVLYTPRPKEWGSSSLWSPYASSTVASSHAAHKQLNQGQKEGELAYEPHSPYYSPVPLPEFYEDE